MNYRLPKTANPSFSLGVNVSAMMDRIRASINLTRERHRARRELTQMLDMQDYMLYDIGISRNEIRDAYLDTFRPDWRP